MSKNTIVVQIGNSDNKLTQKQWSDYYEQIERVVDIFSKEVFFKGCSNSNSEYQNAAFIFSIEENENDYDLMKMLVIIKNMFNQDSIAYQIGETDFI